MGTKKIKSTTEDDAAVEMDNYPEKNFENEYRSPLDKHS